MISQILRPRLEQHFPKSVELFSELSPAPHARQLIARFQATNSEFGDVEIYDDGDEVTIYLGHFTHIHFGCYEEHFALAEKEEFVVKETMDFLSRLFSDEIECWKGRWIGGCGPRGAHKGEVFVWSGRVGHQ